MAADRARTRTRRFHFTPGLVTLGVVASSTRLLLVPRWGGTPQSDFYPWLAALVEGGALNGVSTLERLDMPDASTPRIESWVPYILAALSSQDAPTIVLAHSVGCQATLRALATASAAKVASTLLVAPWRSVDKPWPTLLPWMETPFPLADARMRAGRIRAIVSDDDPFTADWAATKTWLERDLDAVVSVEHGARHFNEKEEPTVLAALASLASPSPR